jgi:hypothetical protein
MEIRAAETGTLAATPAAPAPAPASSRFGRNRVVARAIGLSREAEMDYQRKDLRRLLYTAGVLFVLMIALLIVLG